MGHSTLEMTRRYVQIVDDDLIHFRFHTEDACRSESSIHDRD